MVFVTHFRLWWARLGWRRWLSGCVGLESSCPKIREALRGVLRPHVGRTWVLGPRFCGCGAAPPGRAQLRFRRFRKTWHANFCEAPERKTWHSNFCEAVPQRPDLRFCAKLRFRKTWHANFCEGLERRTWHANFCEALERKTWHANFCEPPATRPALASSDTQRGLQKLYPRGV